MILNVLITDKKAFTGTWLDMNNCVTSTLEYKISFFFLS